MFEKEAQRSFDELDDRGVGDDWSIEESYVNGFSNGADFGYNKANEWHYVKDGDLPKENKKYWIFTSDGEPKVDSWVSISWATFYGVIAWKEIVLPKESE